MKFTSYQIKCLAPPMLQGDVFGVFFGITIWTVGVCLMLVTYTENTFFLVHLALLFFSWKTNDLKR